MGSKEELLNKIDSACRKYDGQLNEFWQMTSAKQRDDLAEAFLKKLEQEWPREFREFTIKNVFDATTERVITSIKMAYIAGYMVGKGWISVEELADFNLYLGDSLTAYIKSIFKRAKVKGLAFAAAFTGVAAEGTLVALSSDLRHPEPSKYDVLNEILLKEGTNIIGKSIKHPELLGQSTPSVSINPFNPSDSEYLTRAFLGGPSHMGHFDAERLETILKKLLQDDYDKYYEAARQRIIASH